MARTIHLEVVTPERKIVSVDTDEVRAPGAIGLFGVRPGHAPFLTQSEPGELSYRADGQLHRYAIGGGFIEVADDKVTVLADTAEAATEIDVERARRAAEDAAKKLAALKPSDPQFPIESARVKRSAARIRVAKGS